MSKSHYKVFAKSPTELRVRGDYFEIFVEDIILDAEVLLIPYEEKTQQCVLFEIVYSNLWDHVVRFSSPLLIDSDGFQHTECEQFEAVIKKSKKLEAETELQRAATELQGKAKTRGWVAFPRLKKPIVPHRLIFEFDIFKPGCTSGYVQHSEMLELIFDLSLYGRLIGEGKK